jgi:hypothetical protein
MSESDGSVQNSVFFVIGEHRDEPCCLLVRGADGRLYRLDFSSGAAIPVAEAEIDQFRIDRAGWAPMTKADKEQLTAP